MWYDVCDMMCVGCEEPEALHTSAYVIIKKKLLDQEGRVPEPLRQTSFLKKWVFYLGFLISKASLVGIVVNSWVVQENCL